MEEALPLPMPEATSLRMQQPEHATSFQELKANDQASF